MMKNLLNLQKKKLTACIAALHTKIFILATLILAPLLFTGCDRENPGIIFSSTPFSKELGYTPQNIFKKGEKIYYLAYNPKEFKTRLVKVQVFRKDDDADEFFGYEYLYNKTVELKNKKFHTDFFVINKKGYYIFQIFEYTNTLKPVIKGIIRVSD